MVRSNPRLRKVTRVATSTLRIFVKFDNLPAADTYVIEFTLDGIYPPMDTTGWLKSELLALEKLCWGRVARAIRALPQWKRMHPCG